VQGCLSTTASVEWAAEPQTLPPQGGGGELQLQLVPEGCECGTVDSPTWLASVIHSFVHHSRLNTDVFSDPSRSRSRITTDRSVESSKTRQL